MAACYRGQEYYGRCFWIEQHSPCPSECLESYEEPQEGRAYIMYHGTSRDASGQILACGFRPSSDGLLGPGVCVSRDLRKASRYPRNLPEHKRVVLKLWVIVGKVMRIDSKGHPVQRTWHCYGYDTAWLPPNCGIGKRGQEEDLCLGP